MMILNSLIIPISFAGIGALTELILLRHPTPGQRLGTFLGIAGMFTAGFFVPLELAEPVIAGFFIAQAGRVFGGALSWAIDKVRVWRVR